MQSSLRKALAGFFLLFPFYLASAPIVLAQADSIIIENDGSVDLVIEKQILGISVQAADTNKNKPSPEHGKTVPVKVIPITSPNTPSTVTVQPAKQEEKKVTVTVTEKPAAKASTAPSSGNSPPAVPPKVIRTQTVDRVVLQGANNTTVVSITTASQNQATIPQPTPKTGTLTAPTPTSSARTGLIIQQETIRASTTLPISIDSVTHALSAPSQQGEVKLILPRVALDSLSNERLLQSRLITQTSQPQLHLSQDRTGDIIYTTQSNGKFLGILSLPAPIVTISNSTGKISASPFARFLIPFFR